MASKAAKAKSKAIVMVADGNGGMKPVEDRRFEQGEWPIKLVVPKERAETWLTYLGAECARSGWSSSSFGQIGAGENSGSITVNGPGATELMAITWERRRGGPIKLRARPSGTNDFSLDQANEFLLKVEARSKDQATEQFHRAWHLFYEGLAWRGEIWLDETLRLGPPSQYDERALFGPRIIIVDAIVSGIEQLHAGATFDVLLRELAVFLSVVMGKEVRPSRHGERGWTWGNNPSGPGIQCEVRNLGFWESSFQADMPVKDQCPRVPLRSVRRPDFSMLGIDISQNEIQLPDDIGELWRAFSTLPPALRQQFLRVATMWQMALSLGQEYQTARFAWMVAACEVLKPNEPQYRNHNIYDVVEALLGKETAATLKEEWFRPQDVRNAHLHRGEFRGNEFMERLMVSSFQDPTFDEAGRVLYRVAQAAIIEWLRRNGLFAMPVSKRRSSLKRWIRDNPISSVSVFTGAGVVGGFILRWVIG